MNLPENMQQIDDIKILKEKIIKVDSIFQLIGDKQNKLASLEAKWKKILRENARLTSQKNDLLNEVEKKTQESKQLEDEHQASLLKEQKKFNDLQFSMNSRMQKMKHAYCEKLRNHRKKFIWYKQAVKKKHKKVQEKNDVKSSFQIHKLRKIIKGLRVALKENQTCEKKIVITENVCEQQASLPSIEANVIPKEEEEIFNLDDINKFLEEMIEFPNLLSPFPVPDANEKLMKSVQTQTTRSTVTRPIQTDSLSVAIKETQTTILKAKNSGIQCCLKISPIASTEIEPSQTKPQLHGKATQTKVEISEYGIQCCLEDTVLQNTSNTQSLPKHQQQCEFGIQCCLDEKLPKQTSEFGMQCCLNETVPQNFTRVLRPRRSSQKDVKLAWKETQTTSISTENMSTQCELQSRRDEKITIKRAVAVLKRSKSAFTIRNGELVHFSKISRSRLSSTAVTENEIFQKVLHRLNRYIDSQQVSESLRKMRRRLCGNILKETKQLERSRELMQYRQKHYSDTDSSGYDSQRITYKSPNLAADFSPTDSEILEDVGNDGYDRINDIFEEVSVPAIISPLDDNFEQNYCEPLSRIPIDKEPINEETKMEEKIVVSDKNVISKSKRTCVNRLASIRKRIKQCNKISVQRIPANDSEIVQVGKKRKAYSKPINQSTPLINKEIKGCESESKEIDEKMRADNKRKLADIETPKKIEIASTSDAVSHMQIISNDTEKLVDQPAKRICLNTDIKSPCKKDIIKATSKESPLINAMGSHKKKSLQDSPNSQPNRLAAEDILDLFNMMEEHSYCSKSSDDSKSPEDDSEIVESIDQEAQIESPTEIQESDDIKMSKLNNTSPYEIKNSTNNSEACKNATTGILESAETNAGIKESKQNNRTVLKDILPQISIKLEENKPNKFKRPVRVQNIPPSTTENVTSNACNKSNNTEPKTKIFGGAVCEANGKIVFPNVQFTKNHKDVRVSLANRTVLEDVIVLSPISMKPEGKKTIAFKKPLIVENSKSATTENEINLDVLSKEIHMHQAQNTNTTECVANKQQNVKLEIKKPNATCKQLEKAENVAKKEPKSNVPIITIENTSPCKTPRVDFDAPSSPISAENESPIKREVIDYDDSDDISTQIEDANDDNCTTQKEQKYNKNISFTEATRIFENLARLGGDEIECRFDLERLKTIKLDRFTQFVLQYLKCDTEDVDQPINPLEPRLTVRAKVLVGVLFILERQTQQNYVDSFIERIEKYLLFNTRRCMDEVENLARVYAATSRARGRIHQVRQFLGDLLYLVPESKFTIIYTIITNWLVLFKRFNDVYKGNGLDRVVGYVIMKQGNVADDPNAPAKFNEEANNVGVLKNLFTTYYQYPKELESADDLVMELIESYMCTSHVQFEAAILVLSAHQPPQWTFEKMQLIGELCKVSKDNDVVENLLRLIHGLDNKLPAVYKERVQTLGRDIISQLQKERGFVSKASEYFSS